MIYERNHCFNGAAPGGAEKQIPKDGWELICGASMEPLRGERKNGSVLDVFTPTLNASMEPLRGERKNLATLDPLARGGVSFNGAAPGGAEKPRRHRRPDRARLA